MKIAMLSTGEEVLHGDIVDTNAAWLGEYCFEHGFTLTKRSTIGDSLSALTQELIMLSLNHDVVFVNGGLGPTSDDLSAQAAANANEVELEMNHSWLETLTERFAAKGRVVTKSNAKQALLPQGAEMIPNSIGTACGFSMLLNRALMFFTPGVPKEFKLMVKTQIIPFLQQQFPQHTPLACSRFYTFGHSESGLGDLLSALQLPEGYFLGYRSALPFIEIKLFGPQGDLETRAKVMALIHNIVKDYTLSIDQSVTQLIGRHLQEKQLTLSLAEQSTFGHLSAWLHDDETASGQLRHSWLLPTHSLEHDNDALAGAFALAAATREKCDTDLSLVTTELDDNHCCAVAMADASGEWGGVYQLRVGYSREEQRKVIATIAIDLLRRFLQSQPRFGQYHFIETKRSLWLPKTASTVLS
ncbi:MULTISPECIES: CinA family nicotinamide mononucleotide deamidase-related protein [unclassified Vibrio]|uniref:CinA-like protein n=1 Tax=Vibrio sp. HB236076 TaxID=3232307 RepID=A0AB39HD62_9VIBR|nr:CinA family nicotinamide mononucleotide deamidase-related protein [Vibrio sp. HB161653]MDP5253526.1 CinA family nicotinamide mononucleotide deamidase-related protein [Vibrio sp. HB161653]